MPLYGAVETPRERRPLASSLAASQTNPLTARPALHNVADVPNVVRSALRSTSFHLPFLLLVALAACLVLSLPSQTPALTCAVDVSAAAAEHAPSADGQQESSPAGAEPDLGDGCDTVFAHGCPTLTPPREAGVQSGFRAERAPRPPLDVPSPVPI
jgi:hypothetical protein